MPDVGGTALRRARWGAQLDVRVLDAGDDADATAIAAYVAKYATKTADGTPGWPTGSAPGPRSSASVLRPHIVAMVRTAWALGGRRDLAALRLRDHAHTLGYPGQFSSKSVRFSTTFGALRRARADYVHGERDEADFDYDGEWRYAGRGYGDPEADVLAATLLEARLEGSRRVPERFPLDFPERFPNAMTRENGCRNISVRGPIREPFAEGVRGTRCGAMAP